MLKKIVSLFVVVISMSFFSPVFAEEIAPSYKDPWKPSVNELKEDSIDPIRLGLIAKRTGTDKPLTLLELVDLALSNNPSTQVAWQNTKKAQALKTQAQAQWYPAITMTSAGKRGEIVSNVNADNSDFLNSSAGATLSFLVWDFGGRNAAVKQAFLDLLNANHSFNKTYQTLLLNIETAYYNLNSAKSDWHAKRADLEAARMAMNVSKRKLNAGLVSILDVYQTKSNFYDTSYKLETAKAAIKTSKGNLAAILGVTADTPLDIEAPPEDFSVAITRENVKHLIDLALEKRPDVSAKRASLRSKEAAVGVAESALWPSVTLSGSGVKDWYGYYHADKGAGNDVQYYGQLAVSWNIFDGYANVSRKRAAVADYEAEKLALVQLEISATQDVWNAFYQFKSAVRKNRFSRANLTASDASYKLALQSYSAGLKNILDLLQAQSDLSTARSNLIESQKELYTTRAQLIYAVGMLGKNLSWKGLKSK